MNEYSVTCMSYFDILTVSLGGTGVKSKLVLFKRMMAGAQSHHGRLKTWTLRNRHRPRPILS